mgnify:CR=1 FL=1
MAATTVPFWLQAFSCRVYSRALGGRIGSHHSAGNSLPSRSVTTLKGWGCET